MVKIVDFKTYEREDKTEFCVLVVQGGVEAVKSKETGKTYFTARKAHVSSTFDEVTCKGLIGTDLPGVVVKKNVDPYEYIAPQTGEVMMLSHRYEYLQEEEGIVNNNVILEEVL